MGELHIPVSHMHMLSIKGFVLDHSITDYWCPVHTTTSAYRPFQTAVVCIVG